jgi:hypothetical protein
LVDSAGIFDPSQLDSRYTVSGTPYISVNSATRKAVDPPIARQSRRVRGWKKLIAKMPNRAVLRMTRGHRPYAVSATVSLLHPCRERVYMSQGMPFQPA